MTLSDLERRDARGHFSGGSPLITFDLKRPNLVYGNTCGEGRVTKGLATPPLQGAEPQHPQILGPPAYPHALRMTYSDKFSTAIKFLQGRRRPWPLRRISVTQMLTCALFAAANRPVLFTCSSARVQFKRSHNFELTHNHDNRNFFDRMFFRNPCSLA